MPSKEKAAPKTVQERQQAQREEKLEQIREQVAAGTLVIRKMTPAERKRHPAQNRQKQRRG
jgi:hypothetical protein